MKQIRVAKVEHESMRDSSKIARQDKGLELVLSVQEKNPNPNVTCKTRDGLIQGSSFKSARSVKNADTKERETLEEDQIRVDHCELSLSTWLDEPDRPDLSPLCLFLFVLPCIWLLFLSWQLVIWFVFK